MAHQEPIPLYIAAFIIVGAICLAITWWGRITAVFHEPISLLLDHKQLFYLTFRDHVLLSVDPNQVCLWLGAVNEANIVIDGLDFWFIKGDRTLAIRESASVDCRKMLRELSRTEFLQKIAKLIEEADADYVELILGKTTDETL